MIRFLLNDKIISTELSPGIPLLDLIRYNEQLTGTKIGCREGDCGACTVLIGSLTNGELRYQSMTSCLLPLANVQGKHVVTVEGINLPAEDDAAPALNLVQQAMAEQGATQCGFCTPGFVVSLVGYCLNPEPGVENAIAAIDGNICRCTGYKSIERAAVMVTRTLEARNGEDALDFAITKKILPPYFQSVKTSLLSLQNESQPTVGIKTGDPKTMVAGGTDLYVQKPEELIHSNADYLNNDTTLKRIERVDNRIILGGAVTVTDLRDSALFNEIFPSFFPYSKLVSSTAIRNMATLAGNLVNASPIGDLSIFFLALDAKINLRDLRSGRKRKVLLREFYKGYKKLDKSDSELLESIECEDPGKNDHFHFEKVSKRTHLDIASVNTAIFLQVNNEMIVKAGLSAGGVAPVPLYLVKTSAYLAGKKISDKLVDEVVEMAMTEISPISDVRGSREYKAFLLAQLIRAHFHSLFEKTGNPE